MIFEPNFVPLPASISSWWRSNAPSLSTAGISIPSFISGGTQGIIICYGSTTPIDVTPTTRWLSSVGAYGWETYVSSTFLVGSPTNTWVSCDLNVTWFFGKNPPPGTLDETVTISFRRGGIVYGSLSCLVRAQVF